MHAITIKAPWAQAIARFGKTVENRSRRPPAHLLGQRIAIHVSQTVDEAAVRLCHRPHDVVDHLEPMLIWAMRQELDLYIGSGQRAPAPNAGRIIATARLVGWIKPDRLDLSTLLPHEWACADDFKGDLTANPDASGKALRSPWFTGPVGWVLADVLPLREPVGRDPCAVQIASREVVTYLPIRGQVYPFALSPEVEAAVLAQGG